MDRAQIGVARVRLLSISEQMEAVRQEEKTDPVVQPLHDAILQLSQVCKALLDGAEEDLHRDPREYWKNWLDREPVGAFVKDNTGDIWRKDGASAWRCWDPVDKSWDYDLSLASDLLAWKPYTTAQDPCPEAAPMPKIKVGDVLTTEAQVKALEGRWGVVMLDTDGDAWVLHERDPDRGYNNSGWYCSHPNVMSGIVADMAHYFPLTVLYLPEE